MRDRDVFGLDGPAVGGVVTSGDPAEADAGGVIFIDATGGLVPRACGKKPEAAPSVVATNGGSVVVIAGATSHGVID